MKFWDTQISLLSQIIALVFSNKFPLIFTICTTNKQMTHLILLGVRRPRQPGGEDRVLSGDGGGLRDRLGGAVQVIIIMILLSWKL